MKLTKCDRCGRAVKSGTSDFYLMLCGNQAINYGDTEAGSSFEYDLCADCAREVVELIEGGTQQCTKD